MFFHKILFTFMSTMEVFLINPFLPALIRTPRYATVVLTLEPEEEKQKCEQYQHSCGPICHTVHLVVLKFGSVEGILKCSNNIDL